MKCTWSSPHLFLCVSRLMSLHAGMLVTPELSSVGQAGGVIQGGLMNLNCS